MTQVVGEMRPLMRHENASCTKQSMVIEMSKIKIKINKKHNENICHHSAMHMKQN